MDGLIPTHEGAAPRPGTFRALPSFRIHLLAGMSARHAEMRFVKQFGLRLLETRIIGLVGTFGALSLKEICRESDIEKSHASKLIGRLLQRGLVEKLEDAADQRAISVRLTDEGRRMHRALYADSVERNERWMAVLTPAERAQLLNLVDRLIEHTRTMMGSDVQDAPTPPDQARPAAAPAPVPGATVPLDLDLARTLHAALSTALAGTPPASEQA